MNTYFVKSFEEDFSSKTLKGTRKVTFQTAQDILTSKVLKPNTKSFGRKQRLSTTILHKNYLKTYRPQGIIFCTKSKPSYVLPCDFVVLTTADKIITHYYRIKNNLHIYYNHTLIPGFENFIFKNFLELISQCPTVETAWKKVNVFRKIKGYPILQDSKKRLLAYNEAVFEKPIKIEPVGLFGRNKLCRKIARDYKIPYYRSARDFYQKMAKTI
jgi:hypothetical protein